MALYRPAPSTTWVAWARHDAWEGTVERAVEALGPCSAIPEGTAEAQDAEARRRTGWELPVPRGKGKARDQNRLLGPKQLRGGGGKGGTPASDLQASAKAVTLLFLCSGQKSERESFSRVDLENSPGSRVAWPVRARPRAVLLIPRDPPRPDERTQPRLFPADCPHPARSGHLESRLCRGENAWRNPVAVVGRESV